MLFGFGSQIDWAQIAGPAVPAQIGFARCEVFDRCRPLEAHIPVHDSDRFAPLTRERAEAVDGRERKGQAQFKLQPELQVVVGVFPKRYGGPVEVSD